MGGLTILLCLIASSVRSFPYEWVVMTRRLGQQSLQALAYCRSAGQPFVRCLRRSKLCRAGPALSGRRDLLRFAPFF